MGRVSFKSVKPQQDSPCHGVLLPVLKSPAQLSSIMVTGLLSLVDVVKPYNNNRLLPGKGYSLCYLCVYVWRRGDGGVGQVLRMEPRTSERQTLCCTPSPMPSCNTL